MSRRGMPAAVQLRLSMNAVEERQYRAAFRASRQSSPLEAKILNLREEECLSDLQICRRLGVTIDTVHAALRVRS